MTNSKTQLTNELNIAVVDALLSLSHHLNSGMIGSFTTVDKSYDVDGTDVMIHCEGGVDNNNCEYILMSADEINEDNLSESMIEYNIKIKATGEKEGGFGSLIRQELNTVFNKEKAVPDYVVESLNSGYACILSHIEN